MPDKQMEHPDEAQDQVQIDANLQQLIEELTPVLEMLIQKNHELEEKVSQLEDILMNKIIGGLGKAKRGEDLNALKGKYGDQFKDLLDYKKAVHGADPEGFFNELLDQLQGAEDPDSLVKGHLDRMTGERDAHKALLLGGAKPDAAVEVKAEGEPEAVKEAVSEVPEQVERAVEAAPKKEEKDEGPAVGSPEYFKRYKGKGKPSSKAQK